MEWFLAMVEEPRQSLAKKCCPCSCTPRTLRVKPNSGALPLSAHTPCFGDRPQAERRPPRQVALAGLGAGIFLGAGEAGATRRLPRRGRQDLRGGAELRQERLHRPPCGAGHTVVRGDARASAGGDDLRGVRAGAGEGTLERCFFVFLGELTNLQLFSLLISFLGISALRFSTSDVIQFRT